MVSPASHKLEERELGTVGVAQSDERPVRIISMDDHFVASKVAEVGCVALANLSRKDCALPSERPLVTLIGSHSSSDEDLPLPAHCCGGAASMPIRHRMVVPPLSLLSRGGGALRPRSESLETPMKSTYQTLCGECLPELAEKIKRAVRENSIIPYPGGKSGGYFIICVESKRPLVVFKPKENELGGDLDREVHGDHLKAKEGLIPGEGAFSEYLAFRFQEILGISIGIPPTWYAQAAAKNLSTVGADTSVRKAGSMQEFVADCIGFDEVPAELMPSISEVLLQMIAAFDIALFNADRNPTNLLVKIEEGKIRVIPIDHGCILPRNCRSGLVACWKDMAQIQKPICPEVHAFISLIEQRHMEHVLRELEERGFSFASLDVMKQRILTYRAAVFLLKKGAELGLSLREIALFAFDRPPYLNVLGSSIEKYKAANEEDQAALLESEVLKLIGGYIAKKKAYLESSVTPLNEAVLDEFISSLYREFSLPLIVIV